MTQNLSVRSQNYPTEQQIIEISGTQVKNLDG